MLETRKINKYLIFLPLVVIIVILLFLFKSINKTQDTSQNTLKNETAKVLGEKNINKNFEFFTKDTSGKPLSLKYNLISAKKVNLIARSGAPIKSSPGEEFLVISIELQNDNKLPLKVNSADFIRLVTKDNKKYAPDFYNGAIDVPPISVKKDEMAFVIESSEKQIKLQIGEIDKEKKEIVINF